MKYKLAKKTSSITDSLIIDYYDKPKLGHISTYDFASLWKWFDSNYSEVSTASSFRITYGGFPMKTSIKDVI